MTPTQSTLLELDLPPTSARKPRRPKTSRALRSPRVTAWLTPAPRSNTTTERREMKGWTVDAAATVSRRLSVVGEFDWAGGSDPARSAYGFDKRWRDLNLSPIT